MRRFEASPRRATPKGQTFINCTAPPSPGPSYRAQAPAFVAHPPLRLRLPAYWSHIWSPARWRDHCSQDLNVQRSWSPPLAELRRRPPSVPCEVPERRSSPGGSIGHLAQETPTDLLRSHNTFLN